MYVCNCKLVFSSSQVDITMSSCRQSHYIEVAQGDIFMKHKMRFGQVLGRLAILKKKGADYEQLLRVLLSCFQGQKNI